MTMTQPDVAIVIPCFNGDRYVAETLRSALDQVIDKDASFVEVIVVDDGSTDRSADIVANHAQADGRLRLVRQANCGVAVARNTGLAACSPSVRFVMFLDADDILVEHAVGSLRNCLQNDPTLVAAFGPCSRVDSAGRLISPPEDPVTVQEVSNGSVHVVTGPDRVGYWRILPMTPISTPGQVLIRRKAIPQGNPFDSTLIGCEDWDLWLRLSRIGDFGVVQGEVLKYRDHSASASKRYALMTRHRETVLGRQRDAITTDERHDFRVAFRYAMYQFDASLCRKWAVERLVDRDLPGALRFTVRSAKFNAKLLIAAALGRPETRPSAHASGSQS
jgi:glycosyltransferase involved in cell wall biosynthesis